MSITKLARWDTGVGLGAPVSIIPVVLNTETVQLTADLHANRPLLLARAAGCKATLPEATGTGTVYEFWVKLALSSNTYVIEAADLINTHIMGTVICTDDDAPTTMLQYQSQYNDTITMNMTTQGGISAWVEWYRLVDVEADRFAVTGNFRVPSGSDPATPFSNEAS